MAQRKFTRRYPKKGSRKEIYMNGMYTKNQLKFLVRNAFD